MNLSRVLFSALVVLCSMGCSRSEKTSVLSAQNPMNAFYSQAGLETKVRFQAVLRTKYATIQDVPSYNLVPLISQVTKFLYGPLTYRKMGGVQKGELITPLMDQASVVDGRVMIPYNYEGVWIIRRDQINTDTVVLPVPYLVDDLAKTDWVTCTDLEDSDHDDFTYLWYFWDPTRPGCKNTEGVDFQTVQVQLTEATEQTKETFPEYANMIHQVDGHAVKAMTFAFGYVADNQDPKPFTDTDAGMIQFQKFYTIVQNSLLPLGFKEVDILRSEMTKGSEKIGVRFVGVLDGVQTEVSVVSNAGIDQMDLFAYSFAVRHEGFFGWFGHSRVGNGFDANNFKYKVMWNPNKFSVTSDYQLIYWAGCNSYSYYTLPFFELKAKLDPVNDPKGTQHLDIISNTLPSLFSFFASDAAYAFSALINPTPTSYQTLIGQIEGVAKKSDDHVIVNVIGDEDNN